MKRFVLLSMFLALPLMAQAPQNISDIVAPYVYRYGLKQLEVESLHDQIISLQAQLKAAQDAAQKAAKEITPCGE